MRHEVGTALHIDGHPVTRLHNPRSVSVKSRSGSTSLLARTRVPAASARLPLGGPAEAAARGFSLKDWYFLTGSLPKLNVVWSEYGVAIDVQRGTHIVSHNDALYFIDPSGRMRLRATPFANESAAGVFSLPRVTGGGVGGRDRSPSQISASGQNMTAPSGTPTTTTSGSLGVSPWYKRRAWLVSATLAVVVAVTVVTDLPQHASRSGQISDDTSVMTQLNTDVAPCSYALGESFAIYRDLTARTLTPSEDNQVPGLLGDDQMACSFTDDNIYQLSTIEVPGSAAGKYMGQLVEHRHPVGYLGRPDRDRGDPGP